MARRLELEMRSVGQFVGRDHAVDDRRPFGRERRTNAAA
jgi:hypothetical protein